MDNKFKNFCNHFIGYENEKEELLRILNWYTDETIAKNQKITLPRGILFHGCAGNGKTTILREYSKCFNATIYNISDISMQSEDEIADKIVELFKKARSEKFAVIIIDEIDHIVNLNSKILRLFQSELDGLASNKNNIVLAATNDLEYIPSSLLRKGRFDRTIEINDPNTENRKILISNFLADLNVDTTNIDIKKIAKRTYGCSGAEIKALINDAYLRFGNNIKENNLEDSYFIIVEGKLVSKVSPKLTERVALNNAGKILMINKFKDLYNFKYAKYVNGGFFYSIENNFETGKEADYLKSKLLISLSGLAAERLYYGKHDIGSVKDLNFVYERARVLIEKECVHDIKNYIPEYDYETERFDTSIKRKKIEKEIESIVISYFKKAYKYLKSNKEHLTSIKDILMKNNVFNFKDMSNLEMFE